MDFHNQEQPKENIINKNQNISFKIHTTYPTTTNGWSLSNKWYINEPPYVCTS